MGGFQLTAKWRAHNSWQFIFPAFDNTLHLTSLSTHSILGHIKMIAIEPSFSGNHWTCSTEYLCILYFVPQATQCVRRLQRHGCNSTRGNQGYSKPLLLLSDTLICWFIFEQPCFFITPLYHRTFKSRINVRKYYWTTALQTHS